MGSEYFINSQQLQDKVASLLPSQGGAGAGFDLSASTQIIPIIDLTEQASGSNLRSDLQRAYGINSETFNVSNATTTILTTTGFFRIIGYIRSRGTVSVDGNLRITDGIASKNIIAVGTGIDETVIPFDVTIFLSAGDSCVIFADTNCQFSGAARQIADINGELVNP